MNRTTILIGTTYVGVALSAVAMHMHNRSLMLTTLILVLIGLVFIVRKVKPTVREVERARDKQAKTARFLRSMGYMYLIFFLIGIAKSRSYKDLPWWGIALGIGFPFYFIWSIFYTARTHEKITPEEWERRIQQARK